MVDTFSHFENNKRPWFVVTGINRHTQPDVYFGNQEEILKHESYQKLDEKRVVVVNAPQIISYHDHPARAVLKKPKSSISVGLNWLSTRKIDVFSSTGNTGAMLVGSIYKSTTIPGVVRPCITSTLPTINGDKTVFWLKENFLILTLKV